MPNGTNIGKGRQRLLFRFMHSVNKDSVLTLRMTEKLLTIRQVSVKLAGITLLDSIDFTFLKGEQWALTGPSGSGKTLLAHILLGRHFYSGEIDIHVRPVLIVEQQHRFRNLSNTTEMYYQQRYNSADSDQTITVEQELYEHDFTGHPGETEKPSREEWVDALHIRPLLSKPLIRLSNGENKRVQLAIALASHPGLLILDNPFLGLDSEGRQTLRQIIGSICEKGIPILLITSRQEIPAAITHIAVLEKGRLNRFKRAELPPEPDAAKGKKLDISLLARLKKASAEDFSVAVRMKQVTIRYGEATILDHIDWEVGKGDKWNLSGPNGAGKSTMLSLITADNPQAYANEIWLFDRKRGSGESIWDIKRKIGFVSPELHLYFDYRSTGFEVIASGLFDTIGLFRRLSDEQEESVLLWMQLLNIGELKTRQFSLMSAGEQRMVLLARALIKNPPLLILDEPCQGLDEDQTSSFRDLIGQVCEAFDTTLIYVSHYTHEIPSCVNRFLRLENGKQAG